MIYTFFGHRDAPDNLLIHLERLLLDLINDDPCPFFYIGTHGNFDAMALDAVRKLQRDEPKIKYAVVLSRLPGKNAAYPLYSSSETLLPDGIEQTPPRFAISYRNQWMLKRANVVITYVRHPFGNAFRMDRAARSWGKQAINLANAYSSIPSSAQATETIGESDLN